MSLCVAGKRVTEILKEGNVLIQAKLAKVYTNKKLNKGMSLPLCVNINQICGFFSPLSDDKTEIKSGDLIKIEFGVHVDHFPAVIGHSFTVGLEKQEDNKLVKCAYTALVNALKVVKDESSSH